MHRRGENWPSFWADRAAPHNKVVEELSTNFGRGCDQIRNLQATAVVQDHLDRITERVPPEESAVKREILQYAYYGSQTAAALCESVQIHWSRGDFVSFCLVGRLILEYASAVYYALRVLRNAQESKDWAQASKLTSPLLVGTRRPFWYEWLPMNGLNFPASVNVLTMVRHWKEQNPTSEDDYAFISEACHPNHTSHYFLHIAGSFGDFGASMITDHMIKTALERYVDIVRRSTLRIGDSLLDIAARLSS